MSSKNIWISAVLAVIVIAVAWSFLDHHSGYPKGLDELSNPTGVASTTSTDSAASVVASTTVGQPVTTSSSTTSQSSVKNLMHTITIQTNKGTIVFETYDADAPKTAANFISLANKGFYNGLIFHRVIEGFMIQGGDPTGTGTGGPGYQFSDELNANTPSYQAGYVRGTVAMANSGANTNGSQFFIMQKDTPLLPHSYTIFGKVISGMDVVDAIAATPVNSSDKPITDVVMTKVTVADTK
jgi:cyclophilin family peptidyl-prolyl cis-trans isomerase